MAITTLLWATPPIAHASATSWYITTIAGNGTAGETGNGGAATGAEFNNPAGDAVDSAGNILVADRNGNVVRVIAQRTATYYGVAMTAGDVYAIAGTGTAGETGDGGAATSAELNWPVGILTDANGNVLISENAGCEVRVVAQSAGTFYGQAMTAGDIYTIAGTGTCGPPASGSSATASELNAPGGLALDPNGNVLITNESANIVSVVAGNTGLDDGISMATGDIYTLAGDGSGTLAGLNGSATAAGLPDPFGAAVDGNGNVLFTLHNSNIVVCLATSTGTFYGLSMTNGDVYDIAGTGTAGDTGDGSSALSAEIDDPSKIAIDSSGNLLIADGFQVSSNPGVRIVAHSTGTFYGESMTAGDIYTIAGDGTVGDAGNGVLATSGELDQPDGLAIGNDGDIIIADIAGMVIRELYPGSGQDLQTVTASISAGTLAITPTTSVSLGTLVPGSSGNTVGLGPLSWTDTLNDGAAPGVTVNCTDLYGGGTKDIPFDDMAIQVDQTISGIAGNTGPAWSAGVASPGVFTGTDTTPGTTPSTGITLATATSTSEGTYTQSNNQIVVSVPANQANDPSLSATLQFTITG